MNTLLRRGSARLPLLALAGLVVATSCLVVGCPPAAAQPITAPAERSANPAQNDVAAARPVALIVVNSYQELISDITFLGNLGGRPEVGQMIEGFVALFTQGKGLAGLDKTKPWGILVQNSGGEFVPIGCLPIRDVNATLELVEAFGVLTDDLGDGVTELDMPDGQILYVKEADGWAFVARDQTAFTAVPADPLPALSTLADDYDIGLRISIQAIPEEYRQLAVEQLRGGMAEGLEQEDDEDDETFEARRRMAEAQLDQLVRMIEDIDELTIGWSIDERQQRLFLDFMSTFVADSKTSRQLQAQKASTTNFAGFFQPEAAASMVFATKSDPELIRADVAQFKSMMETVRKQAASQIDKADDIPEGKAREVMKEAVNEFMDAMEATVEAGEMDGGFVLNLAPDALTLVAGGHILQPEKVESGIKKLVELAKDEPDFPGISWNAETHDGINFHTMQIPIDEDEEEARRLLGSAADIALGIGTDSIYVAIGRNNLAAVKGIIDASRAAPNKSVPPFEFSVSITQIIDMIAAFDEKPDNRKIAADVAEMLRSDARGRDHIRVVAQMLPKGVRYRLEAEEGVLRAIGKAADAAQKAGAADRF